MEDERPKKSWREIDRMREHKSERSTTSRTPARARSQKSYRAALDRLFDSGKIGALVKDSGPPDSAEDAPRLKLLKAVKDAEGREAITTAVDAYLQAHELPEDFDLLTKVLEHRDEKRQRDALTLLTTLTERGERPRRTRGLLGQLRLLRDVADEPRIVELATNLIETLE